MDYDVLIINADIDHSLMETVLNIERRNVASRLLILMNTGGGIPFFAYRAMAHLNVLYPKSIEAVVPDMAMSSGTLMCVGVDRIYMSPGSCLGPLDLQVPHPTDGGQISSLDIREAANDIFGLTTSVTQLLYEQAVNKMKLGKNQAAKITHDAAVKLLEPIVDKIDPYHLHASYRSASIGEHYAYILLCTRMMKSNYRRAAVTSRILTEDYEMHSYAITMDEAKSHLNLTISDIVDLDLYQEIQPYLSPLPKGIKYIPVRKQKPTAGDKQSKLPLKGEEGKDARKPAEKTK